MNVIVSDTRNISQNDIIPLYRANNWSSADKPEELLKALRNSHSLFTAWHNDRLVGLGNAISDGHLVVYYPHLLVLPDYHGRGIGRMIMAEMNKVYGGYHMQMITSDGETTTFYEKCGFKKAGQTQAMWIYKGEEH